MKSCDIIYPIHIPLPSLTDIEVILSIDPNNIQNQLQSRSNTQRSETTLNANEEEMNEMKVVKMLYDRLKSRANRLINDYKSLGYNLHVTGKLF